MTKAMSTCLTSRQPSPGRCRGVRKHEMGSEDLALGADVGFWGGGRWR
eukprot:CAMPEP_0175842646 /NCGR_PEP_ID=MMETSP0107_2-20121207/20640_1 /TAXON_ID=195067 ORGANISM="Goniomonas pacifica, Strain CCMP1869" /NCGR_SAMPLE_ID=MMETSP0107_2 /ASSEMBLY_ACC=CAM_ASM_000203 /LENGTH=47 /DNA_ID= /DNA_START= /DNA_END= /DNA_ORIENTATION=